MYSQMDELCKLIPILWINPGKRDTSSALSKLELNERDMEEAERRWRKFAPLIEKLFPETQDMGGIIESKLVNIPEMKSSMEGMYGIPIEGSLYLKCDSHLPVAGSIKARGGIYEVLKHAEELALKNGMISEDDDYSIMAGDEFKEFFSRYSLAVGSTGNLGLSIGIMGSALGFKVTVHMSADAKEWKKDILRRRGVEVIEYASDYSKAVEEGRRKSLENPMSYFVDDENSKTLFLGYSTAAYRLKRQLDEAGITVDSNHPLFVYLPCGVGGAPGGICFGLKNLLGDNVHCFFGEPTHSPCMLLGLMTGKHDKVSVRDFGLDNITDADGLAVGRPSGFVGRVIGELISGIYTVEDGELYRLLSSLIDSEGIKIEPSAAASLFGPVELYRTIQGRDYIKKENLEGKMKDSTHIAWATGGLFVPENLMKQFYKKGKALG